MTRLSAFVLSLTLLMASAAQALTLEEALQATPERPAVATARTELRDAVINLERTRNDPLAVRSDTLQAEQRLELARANFEQTFYSALQEIASAYTNVLQARQGAAVAEKGVAVSTSSFEIAQIRLQNGSGTQLDLDEARTGLDEAENGLRSAQDNLSVALSNLESILDQELEASELETVPDAYLVQIPVLPTVLQAAEGHPTVLQAEQGLELSELQTSLLDPSYASRAQIDQAETGALNAGEGARETRRGFRIQARNLYNQTESAQETYQTEQAALRNANERLATQQQRFEGGLIARIELSQAELSNMQAELEALQARYSYLGALLDLQAGTLVDLPGPEVLDAPETDPIEASASFQAAVTGETGAAPDEQTTSDAGASPTDTSQSETQDGTQSEIQDTMQDSDSTQNTQEQSDVTGGAGGTP